MTREEAYKEVTKLRPMYHTEIIELLDEVYRDFEDKACENCRWFNSEAGSVYGSDWMTCADGYKEFLNSFNKGEYSCSKWEAAHE